MKWSRSMPLRGFLLWGCLLAFASPVQAALLAHSFVVYDEGFFDGPTTVAGVPAVGGGTSAVGYTSGTVGGLAASGSATVSYGALHASAFSAAANPGVGATSRTRGLGSAFWSDQLTFASDTLTGSAFARATFSLSGAFDSLSDLGTTGNSSIAAAIWVNGGTVFSATGQRVSQSGVITIDDMRRGQGMNGSIAIEPVSSLTGRFSFDIPFDFGVAFQMAGSLDALAEALSGVAGNVASAHSNFGSSGLWGGISEVHLADGTVLSNYSLSSASGFDWIKAFPTVPGSTVPLPGTLWLFGVALLGLMVARRRTAQAV